MRTSKRQPRFFVRVGGRPGSHPCDLHGSLLSLMTRNHGKHRRPVRGDQMRETRDAFAAAVGPGELADMLRGDTAITVTSMHGGGGWEVRGWPGE